MRARRLRLTAAHKYAGVRYHSKGVELDTLLFTFQRSASFLPQRSRVTLSKDLFVTAHPLRGAPSDRTSMAYVLSLKVGVRGCGAVCSAPTDDRTPIAFLLSLRVGAAVCAVAGGRAWLWGCGAVRLRGCEAAGLWG